jgi:hypothetical protein
MIFVGIDDTDMPETPGTNKLAFRLAEQLAADFTTEWIVRHQLLVHPRIRCTNKNGCVAMALKPRAAMSVDELIPRVRRTVVQWSPPGSDPGLCVATDVPDAVVRWGQAAQTKILEQPDARSLAADAGVHLEPLGGTGDGVIGALAAVGLLNTWNSGRVVHCARFPASAIDATGRHDAAQIYAWGVDDIQALDRSRVESGIVDLGKRLRPNLRNSRIVLYVAKAAPGDPAHWIAQRIVA